MSFKPNINNQTTPSPTGASPTAASPTTPSPTAASPTTPSPTGQAPSPTAASPTTPSPTAVSPTAASPTGASPTGASPTAASPLTNISVAPAPKTWSPSPPLAPVGDNSIVPMIGLLIFALTMGIVLIFRKHIRKVTPRRNVYHSIDEDGQEPDGLEQEMVETTRTTDNQLTDEAINNMI